jgi:hypothetical protein
MPVPYDPTFQLVGGAITIAWNARPAAVQYDPQMLQVVAPIPSGNQSRVQNMGHGGDCDYDWGG